MVEAVLAGAERFAVSQHALRGPRLNLTMKMGGVGICSPTLVSELLLIAAFVVLTLSPPVVYDGMKNDLVF